jgi:hypothetical protein
MTMDVLEQTLHQCYALRMERDALRDLLREAVGIIEMEEPHVFGPAAVRVKVFLPKAKAALPKGE